MTDKTILLGLVGSHAYGLNHADSDRDYMGVFVAPTTEVAGLDWHSSRESKNDQQPGGHHDDTALHEIGKYLRLVLKSNPTVTELLWLDEYVTGPALNATRRTNEELVAEHLLGIRGTFLSQKFVLSAYKGYATQQLKKFSTSGEWKPKHARHCLRLINQGISAFETGEVQVQVDNPQMYFDLAEMEPEKVLALLTSKLARFDNTQVTSPLPMLPDDRPARDLLSYVRRTFF